jgi:hypothetical protein
MRYVRFCFFVTLTVIFTAAAAAQTQEEKAVMPLRQLDSGQFAIFRNDIDIVTAEIENPAGAERIMSTLLAKPDGQPVDTKTFKDKNFYCIIHVLSWSAPSADDNKQTVVADNWYLYNQGQKNWSKGAADLTPRLYGAKDVTLLVLHLNKEETNQYTPGYEIKVEKKTPAYIANLLALAGLFPGQRSGGGALDVNAPKHYWGTHRLEVQHRPSDITITPKGSRTTSTGAPLESVALGEAQKFDNEGKYFIDFSVGVPVKKISQLSFESTNGLVTAKEVDETDIMAFVNLHPRPIDVKRTGYNKVPHFVGGVAIGRKPLDKIFVGAGFGPVVANFYVGALFVKQDQLTNLDPGDPATPAQVGSNVRRRYKTQVGFGLNLPVGAIVEKLKNK